jgi:hypothetical protein
MKGKVSNLTEITSLSGARLKSACRDVYVGQPGRGCQRLGGGWAGKVRAGRRRGCWVVAVCSLRDGWVGMSLAAARLVSQLWLPRSRHGGLGDADGAQAAYQQAIDSGNADVTAQALVNRGHLLMGPYPDYGSAQTSYEQAIGSGHPD